MSKKQYPKKTIKHRTNRAYLEAHQKCGDEVRNEVTETREEDEAVSVTPAEEYEAYKQQYLRRGFLRAQALEAQKVLPLKDVKIEIFKDFPSGRHVISSQITDESGLIEAVELPALDAFESTIPGINQPYTTYDLKFTKPGYTTIIIRDVPVYQDITTLQERNMVIKPITPDAIDVLEYSVKPPVV